MTRDRLEITASTHGMALSAYLLAAIFGVTQLFGVSTSDAMVSFLGKWGALAWAMSLATVSVMALSSSLVAPRTEKITGLQTALQAELLAVGGIAFCLSQYLVALVLVTWTDPYAALSTKLMSVSYVIGGITRGIQILRELRRLRHWKE